MDGLDLPGMPSSKPAHTLLFLQEDALNMPTNQHPCVPWAGTQHLGVLSSIAWQFFQPKEHAIFVCLHTGSGNGKYEERRREARTAYQKVVELVAAAGTQGNKYSPEGRLPEAAPRSAILLGTGAATSTSSLGTGAALGEGDGAASSEHSGAPGGCAYVTLSELEESRGGPGDVCW
eukprot:scaffold114852_cov20-Tisochrysis_lutea.AAC.1